MTARTVSPDAAIEELLAEKIAHRSREWARTDWPVPSPERYAEHAVELIRRAVDPDAA